ncbi:hypothetical protein [Nitrogeniibacter aestuarii]|uniref:hypothetical protein n=1 Tax=Nitrogeniibacter aestuarii TaxID=2815343 RepID=UPI001E52C067|nr:hypothetical protein [Nitrogeniibacter aestuarii]
MAKITSIHLIAFAFGLCLAGHGVAAERMVVVNGQRMTPAQIDMLDQAACARVPNGRYWINMSNGVWGYEGGPPQGRVGDACRQRRRSLSERGLLYSPGELLR